MTREEEQKIIQQISAGDVDAYETLVTENQNKVYSLALRMVGNEEDAKDMAQEAFIRAYNSLGSFRGDSRFSVWLYRLTSNICIDFIRSRGKRQSVSLTFDDEDGAAEELQIPDDRFSPENELERREMRAAVSRGLNGLSPEYREILVLREINGMSYEEIGRELGLEEGTVKSRIFRARKKLCAFLVDDGNISGAVTSYGRKGGEALD